mgnify:CR=1 FL=1
MFYKTRNITLAAYLKAEGLRLDNVERNQGNQVTFVFMDPNSYAERYEEIFKSGDAEANIKKFMDELNGLRDIIFKG